MTFLFAGTNQDVNPVGEKYFARIYNKMLVLGGVYEKSILQQDGYRSYFSAISQKQFWWQRGVIRADFARINYIFLSEPCEYHHEFEKQFGISVKIFIGMMLSIWSHIKIKSDIIYVDYNDILTHYGFEKNHIACFLQLVSRDKNALKRELEAQDRSIKSNILKFGEQTPLYKYPILRINESNYICFSRNIIERSIYYNLFEFVKSLADDNGARCFTDRFERYVGDLIDESGAEYISEKEIENLYDGKKTDYLVFEDDFDIMVEAKSIRLSNIAKANPEKKIILNDLEDSVVKSIFQGNELSKNLHENGRIKRHALLIVCYDDIYLGPPDEAYNYFFKDHCEQKFSDGTCARGEIPPENIFILSINEFERFCAVRKEVGSFSKTLDSAISDNKNPETRKFTLDQSFPDLRNNQSLNIIEDNYEKIWAPIIKGLPSDT
jgi:hypothetical protein